MTTQGFVMCCYQQCLNKFCCLLAEIFFILYNLISSYSTWLSNQSNLHIYQTTSIFRAWWATAPCWFTLKRLIKTKIRYTAPLIYVPRAERFMTRLSRDLFGHMVIYRNIFEFLQATKNGIACQNMSAYSHIVNRVVIVDFT